jgi:putative transposase
MAAIDYRYCHFPPPVIQHAVWLYARFSPTLRDVEDLMAERGIEVSYETVRRWVAKFGPQIAWRQRAPRSRPHSQWHLDEMFVSIGGRRMYLWRVIDRNGEILDVLVQRKRAKRATLTFMRTLLKKNKAMPRTIVTDKLGSYAAAFRSLKITVSHHQGHWKNNRIEGSRVYVRRRERKILGFRSPGSAQRFLSLHATTDNAFNTRRHLISAADHRQVRSQAFVAWREAAGIAA